MISLYDVDDDDVEIILISNIRHELHIEKIKLLSKKRLCELKDFEVFELIKNGKSVGELFPIALDIIDKGADLYIDFEYHDDAFSILENHREYLINNKTKKDRLLKLKRQIPQRGQCIDDNTKRIHDSYLSKKAAEEYSNDDTLLIDRFGEQAPYKCDKCGLWRLSHCKDCNICKKKLYFTRGTAMKSIEHRANLSGEYLRMYKCEHQDGWHITSKM